MDKALIKIVYRQVIDSSLQGTFEKNVFNYSYDEFWLKSQVYNPAGKFETFTKLKGNDGRANSLHYKSGFAIGGFVGLLKNKIPYLQGSLGESILFDTHKLEVIESHINDKSVHKVAIHYTTDTLTLFGNIGDYMLLATGDHLSDPTIDPVDTFLLKMQDNLSIASYQSIELNKEYKAKNFGANTL